MVGSKQKNAGLYIRVSTERQVREGYSVSAQKDNLSNFARQQGWKIFNIYADEGISAKNIEDRPEVKKLISDIKNKLVDVVVLYKFDRLTRDSKDTEEIIELIQNCGIEVFTLSGGVVDVSTATGRFTVRVNGAVAQLEREQTIERVKIAFEQKVKQGYTLACATTCYGYDRKIHEKEQTINKEESKIVKRIFKMYLDGKTLSEICNILNMEKVPTKKAGRIVKKRYENSTYTINSIWMPKTIRLILSNPTYIGKVRYHIGKEDGFVVDGKHEPIISQNMWNEVQIKLSKIKTTHKTNLPKDDVYYCGTLVCGICGKKLTTCRSNQIDSKGNKVVFKGYRCVNREKKLCTCMGMSHKKVENAFLDYMDNIEDLTEIDNIEIKDKNCDIEELENLKKRLMQANNKKREVMDLFMLDNITHEQLKYMTKELDEKINILKQEISSLELALTPKEKINKQEISKTIKEHWQYLSNRERLEFLNNFVKEITIVNRNKDKKNGKPEILNVKFYD